MRAAAGTPTVADRKFDLMSLGTFAVLGLPDGMLGTAWPAMRHSFGAPVGDLGLILLINTIGSVAVAAIVGRLIRRLGAAAVLAVAGSCAALAAIGYTAAPGLWLILSVGPLIGAAAG
jgi:MFS family permease